MENNSLLPAIITAITSIIVAIIGKFNINVTKGRLDQKTLVKNKVNRQKFLKNNRTWNYVSTLYIIWIVIAALFLHWDIAGMSYLGIPILFILSFIYPINPFKATSLTLLIFAFCLFAEPIGKIREGISISNHFYNEAIWLYIGSTIVIGLSIWFTNSLRLKVAVTQQISMDNKLETEDSANTELIKLFDLYKKGILTEDEFNKAKDRLIKK